LGRLHYKTSTVNHVLSFELYLKMAETLPMTTIAGIEVVWTPIVRDAFDYAKANADDMTFRHIIRSWLFGVLEIANNPNLASSDLKFTPLAPSCMT
jgi:hypothetical protein